MACHRTPMAGRFFPDRTAYKDTFAIDRTMTQDARHTAIVRAAQPHDEGERADLLARAIALALRVERNNLKLGAALACAWSISGKSLRPEPLPALR